MNIELLIESIVGLIVILVILIVLFVLPARKKRKKQQEQKEKEKKQQQPPKKEEVLPFEELLAIVKSKTSSEKDLEFAIDQIIKYHSKIPPKMGIRSHPELDKYIALIVFLVRHKNTNKNIILKLDRALIEKNPSYKAELNDALTKALNSRGG
jgi:hypothetical protein